MLGKSDGGASPSWPALGSGQRLHLLVVCFIPDSFGAPHRRKAPTHLLISSKCGVLPPFSRCQLFSSWRPYKTRRTPRSPGEEQTGSLKRTIFCHELPNDSRVQTSILNNYTY